jgi:hypothetical protein
MCLLDYAFEINLLQFLVDNSSLPSPFYMPLLPSYMEVILMETRSSQKNSFDSGQLDSPWDALPFVSFHKTWKFRENSDVRTKETVSTKSPSIVFNCLQESNHAERSKKI